MSPDLTDAGPAVGVPGPRPCGCPEGERAGLTRRHLFSLAGAAGLITATTLSDARVAFAAGAAGTAATGAAGDVLVVISLRGGFDGLSGVVPVGDPAYAAARPTIALPAASLHKVDSMFGLAPGLSALYPLWDAGKVAAVHAVGQEAPTRSHFEAMAELERAAPGSSLRSGWIDRSVGMLAVTGAFSAAQVGNPTLPASLYGEHDKFALQSLDQVKVAVDENLVSVSAWKKSIGALHRGAAPEVTRPTAAAIDAVGKIKNLPKSADARGAGYPDGGLGAALHDVARLVKADLGLRFATVDQGNYDMHENLGGPTGGWMFNQLTELSGAMAAFAKELGKDLDRVTVVTISEFGRRVEQNGSGGLDHGHGNVVLVMGGGVKGGKVYGRWPGLAAPNLDDGDLAGTTDYRNVMAEILTKRCGIGSVATVFPGLKPAPLGLVTARA